MDSNDQSVIMEGTRSSALALYQSLRTELIERVKLRDQILTAYLGAVAALIGFSLGTSSTISSQHLPVALLTTLLVLLPLLSLGTAAMICHHQEIMSVFTEYIANELNQWIAPFPVYDGSKERMKFGPRAEFHILLSQLPILCGPWFLVVLLDWPYRLYHFGQKEILLLLGFVVNLLCAARLVSVRNFRRRVLQDIYQPTGSLLAFTPQACSSPDAEPAMPDRGLR